MINRFLSAFYWIIGVALSVAIVLAIAVALTFGLDKLDAVVADRKFNNGICTECGGNYVFVQAVGHQISTDYIYECDGCGRHIEIPKYK